MTKDGKQGLPNELKANTTTYGLLILRFYKNYGPEVMIMLTRVGLISVNRGIASKSQCAMGLKCQHHCLKAVSFFFCAPHEVSSDIVAVANDFPRASPPSYLSRAARVVVCNAGDGRVHHPASDSARPHQRPQVLGDGLAPLLAPRPHQPPHVPQLVSGGGRGCHG
jgi:hypothetical protein